MSRLSTGSAIKVEAGYSNPELELKDPKIIAELREALGAIPEVTKLYGTVAETVAAYDQPQLRGESAPAANAYSSPDLKPSGESAAPNPHVDANLRLAPAASGPMAAAAAPVVPSAAATYESVKKETDHRLAKLAGFLPDKLREALDKNFTDAVKLAQDKSNEGYEAATRALTKLQESLDGKAPELRGKENDFLRKQVKHSLDTERGVLPKNDKKAFVDRFSALDKDLPAEEGEAKTQLDNLQTLSSDIGEAIDGRLKAISDLCVDYERLAPIVKRALSIKSDQHDGLEKAQQEIEDGFAGQFVRDGLATVDIQAKLSALKKTVQDIFKNFTVDDALVKQKGSLPAAAASLKPNGPALGSGAFGEVFELDNDGAKKLVGKSFPAGNADARKEMEHEAEIYARIGEHPNIAQCYGIQDVKGSPMLVMDMIEGKNVEKVFDDLNKRYRDKKISREEYLASTQHLIKGTLTGLAHMEAMGLVHKDIKGDNIKFDTRTNQAVLIDMGLAQPEGDHLVPKAFTPIAPPESFALKKGDKRVTTFWDSFTVGKMLFEEMERDQGGERQVLVTGGDEPIKKQAFFTQEEMNRFKKGATAATKRTASGELEAVTDAKGQLVGQALKSADTPAEAAESGRYGAATQYVDFMNRLTHPDPKQRLSPSEALKHPFMTDTMLSGEELDRVFGKPTGSQPKDEKKSKPLRLPT